MQKFILILYNANNFLSTSFRIILEADSHQVVQRVALRTDDIPIGEQTVAQVLQSAKEQLKWSILKWIKTVLLLIL